MSKIESLTLNVASNLGKRLNKTEEEKSVINYGLFIIIHTFISIMATVLVGIITGLVTEMIVISITASSLKRYSGGVHASTPERCTIIGILYAFILGKICVWSVSIFSIELMLLFLAISSIVSNCIMYKKCPVPSKNKPLKKESTRMKLRKRCFRLMIFYHIAVILLYMVFIYTRIDLFKTIMLSISLGISLQAFSMAKTGDMLVSKLDRMLNIFKI